MWIVTQPETPETELLWIGPIYALLIMPWSLLNMLLGVLEFSMLRKAVLLRSIPVLFIANVFLTETLWGQIGYWQSMEIQMLVNYSPFLIPCLIVDVAGLLYVKRGENLAKALRDVAT